MELTDLPRTPFPLYTYAPNSIRPIMEKPSVVVSRALDAEIAEALLAGAVAGFRVATVS